MGEAHCKKKHCNTNTATHCKTLCHLSLQFRHWLNIWSLWGGTLQHKHCSTKNATHCKTLCHLSLQFWCWLNKGSHGRSTLSRTLQKVLQNSISTPSSILGTDPMKALNGEAHCKTHTATLYKKFTSILDSNRWLNVGRNGRSAHDGSKWGRNGVYYKPLCASLCMYIYLCMHIYVQHICIHYVYIYVYVYLHI